MFLLKGNIARGDLFIFVKVKSFGQMHFAIFILLKGTAGVLLCEEGHHRFTTVTL